MTHIESILDHAFRLQRLLRKQGGRKVDGTTMLQWYVVGVIAHEPGITTSKLAEEMGVALPTATNSVDKLVASGLAERSPDDNDRRISHLGLTARGHIELSAIKSAKVSRAQEVLGLISKTDQAHLDRIIQSLVTALEAQKDKTTV